VDGCGRSQGAAWAWAAAAWVSPLLPFLARSGWLCLRGGVHGASIGGGGGGAPRPAMNFADMIMNQHRNSRDDSPEDDRGHSRKVRVGACG
jgi:hypothetical protein